MIFIACGHYIHYVGKDGFTWAQLKNAAYYSMHWRGVVAALCSQHISQVTQVYSRLVITFSFHDFAFKTLKKICGPSPILIAGPFPV
jgi:hypothetical protein